MVKNEAAHLFGNECFCPQKSGISLVNNLDQYHQKTWIKHLSSEDVTLSLHHFCGRAAGLAVTSISPLKWKVLHNTKTNGSYALLLESHVCKHGTNKNLIAFL